MITKEDCRLLYNIYSQIETTDAIISDLEAFVKENGGKVPDVMDCDYKTYESIKICIPHFEEGKLKCGSATVYKICYDAALLVLKDHVYNLRKQAKELSDKLEKGVRNEQHLDSER